MSTFKEYLMCAQYKNNLLSISKLTIDNTIVVECNSDFCLVKDKEIRVVLLKGNVKDELYQFQPSTDVVLKGCSNLVNLMNKSCYGLDNRITHNFVLHINKVDQLCSIGG